MEAPRILVVGDWEDTLAAPRNGAKAANRVEIEVEPKADQALSRLADESWDALVVDTGTPGAPGAEFAGYVRKVTPDVPILMCPDAVSASWLIARINMAASEYLPRQLQPAGPTVFANPVGEAPAGYRNGQSHSGAPAPGPDKGPDEIVGRSPAVLELRKLPRRAARVDSRVLLTGESGTGKELAARFIHRHSNRPEHPFIPINCAALPRDLVESELFGHEKGAFTGAVSSKPGLIEVASGGVLFLDEIADLPLELQPKLLRVVTEYRRVLHEYIAFRAPSSEL